MNERIRELLKQSLHWSGENVNRNLYSVYEIQQKEYEKFAELIVQECIDCLKPLSRNHSMVGAAQDTIKEHFGVEE